MDTVKKSKTILLFVLPCLIIYTLIVVYPLFKSLYFSFFSWKGFGPMSFVGMNNYIRLLSDDIIWIALRNTLYMILSALLIMLPVSLLLANSLNSIKKWNKFFSTVLYLPAIISIAVMALMWSKILNADSGPVNMALKALHLNHLALIWLGDPKIAIFAVLFVNTWQFSGYHMLIFFASLQSIPDSVMEAAEIDGANGWQKLWHITIPLLQSAIKVNVILMIIGSFKAFDIVYAMTLGGPQDSTQMLSTYMYENTFLKFNFGYGSSIAMTIFILCILGYLAQQKLQTEEIIQF